MPADTGASWRAERSCPICWSTFAPSSSKHRYCSDRCRKTGHARRHANVEGAAEPITRPAPAPVAVRACPHCGEEASIVALLITPEAARPSLPEPGVVRLRRA